MRPLFVMARPDPAIRRGTVPTEMTGAGQTMTNLQRHRVKRPITDDGLPPQPLFHRSNNILLRRLKFRVIRRLDRTQPR
jgi:hypothetical protein